MQPAGFETWTATQWMVAGVTAIAIWAFCHFIGRQREEVVADGEDEEEAEPEIPEEIWDERFAVAKKVVKETVEALPEEVRAEARSVPCIFERWPPEGYDRGTLGLYTGWEAGKVSQARGPIHIFVGGHHVMDTEGEADFAVEVRRTYLHELGHHLGLDEGEMEERGLV